MSWFAAKKDIPKSVIYELEERLEKRRRDSFAYSIPSNRGSKTSREGAIVLEQKTARGWHFVFLERDDVIDVAFDVLSNLSAGTEVVACYVEEHVMCSRAACWKNAKQAWSADYDADASEGKFKTSGELPPAFKSIYAAASSKQGAPDEIGDFMFDVPVQLAESITGYRYDQAF